MGIDVRVFESAPVAGGRCTTRLWQGHLVDLGVQYFTAQSTEFKKELLTRLRQFRPIISPIVNHHGHVIDSTTGPRFYVLQGNNYFAHVLSLGIDIRLETPVESISLGNSGIEIHGETYQAVVSALPGPLTARLFVLTQSPAAYDPCLVALLEYAGTNVGMSRECYGRVLPEGSSPIAASYCENNKVGRIVGNKTVFVIQTSPGFSREHASAPPETYLPALARENEELWHIPAGLGTASFSHFWTYARPQSGTQHLIDLPHGCFLCGDSRVNPTVEEVWTDGRKAAADVMAYLAASRA